MKQTAFEIGTSVERVLVAVGQWVPGDRVDREVAPPAGLFERHRRIACDVEAFVASARLRFTAGKRDVEAGHLVDGKALAHGLDPPERRQERRKLFLDDAEDLEIDVFGGLSPQAVAYPAADDQGAASGVADALGDCTGQLEGCVLTHAQIMLRTPRDGRELVPQEKAQWKPTRRSRCSRNLSPSTR